MQILLETEVNQVNGGCADHCWGDASWSGAAGAAVGGALANARGGVGGMLLGAAGGAAGYLLSKIGDTKAN